MLTSKNEFQLPVMVMTLLPHVAAIVRWPTLFVVVHTLAIADVDNTMHTLGARDPEPSHFPIIIPCISAGPITAILSSSESETDTDESGFRLYL